MRSRGLGCGSLELGGLRQLPRLQVPSIQGARAANASCWFPRDSSCHGAGKDKGRACGTWAHPFKTRTTGHQVLGPGKLQLSQLGIVASGVWHTAGTQYVHSWSSPRAVFQLHPRATRQPAQEVQTGPPLLSLPFQVQEASVPLRTMVRGGTGPRPPSTALWASQPCREGAPAQAQVWQSSPCPTSPWVTLGRVSGEWTLGEFQPASH